MIADKGGLALVLVAAVPEAKHLLAIVHLGAAPSAVTIFPKHPHVEGRSTFVPEVEGAPPAQAARAGKCLPAAGQGYVARGGSLDRNPRGLATATIHLQPESAWTGGGSSPAKKRGSWSQLPAGLSDQTTNSGDTLAEWKRGRGGRATIARLPSSAEPPWMGRSPPRAAASPRRWATTGVAACLRGWPRPRLGAGEPGPSRGAFPFSAAENFFRGAIDGTASSGAEKQASEEEMGNGGSAPLHIYSKRRPTGISYDRR